MTSTLERCRDAFAAIKGTSPASRLLTLSLGGWFASTIAHEHRHLDQARRAREVI